jgi:hypothetical protein
MQRLYEEVSSRLIEMAQVVSRNLDFDGDLYPSFAPLTADHHAHDPKPKKDGRGGQAQKKRKKKKVVFVSEPENGISIVCNADHSECGCYYYDLGICGPCV